MSINIENLKLCKLFKGMEEKVIEELLNELKWYEKKYKKEETISFRGEEIDHFIICMEGELYTEMQKPNGEFVKIDEIKKGGVVASAFVFGNNPKFPVDLYSRTASRLIYIDKFSFLSKMQENRVLLLNYINDISNKTQFLSERIWFNFSNKSISEKLATYFMRNQNDESIVVLKTTIKELAEKFAVARPSLSRVLKEFLDEGLIEKVGRNKYRVISEDLLNEKLEKE